MSASTPLPSPFSAAVTRNNLVCWTQTLQGQGPRPSRAEEVVRVLRISCTRSSLTPLFLGASASRFRAGRPRSICGLCPWFENPEMRQLFPSAPLRPLPRVWQVTRRHPDADPWRGCSDLVTIWSSCASAGYGLRVHLYDEEIYDEDMRLRG